MSQHKNAVQVAIMLGSNQGNRMEYLTKARELISQKTGKIIQESSVYETAPWGKKDQPYFLNQVVKLETNLAPLDLLEALLEIEKLLGRSRREKWASRTIDLDILFYGDRIISLKKLVIPHPRIVERKFTLLPLTEIMPSFIHPVLSLSMHELAARCNDSLPVHRIPGSAVTSM